VGDAPVNVAATTSGAALAITLELTERATDDARALIGELEAELSGAYAADQRHGLSVDRVFQPGIRFFIARLDGRPVGCGGIAFEDGFAELKRMYVRPAARGRGVVQALINRLEEEARTHGYARVTLETGDAQLAAIRAYERAGYRRCAAFGSYATLEPCAIVRSVFFEKLA
jgi:putative acetyltransferase